MNKQILLFSLILLCFLSCVEAETKSTSIGVVDMSKIFLEYPPAKEAQERYNKEQQNLEKEFQLRLDKYKQMVTETEKLQEEVKKAPAALREAKKREYEEKLEKLQQFDRECVEYRSTKLRQIQEEFITLRKKLIADLLHYLEEIKKEHHLDLILDRSGLSAAAVPLVLLVNEDLDLTAEVLQKLTKKKS